MAEARRIFPNTLDIVWFRDSRFSIWVSNRIKRYDAKRKSDGSVKFSEHDVGLMQAVRQVDVVVLSFLTNGHKSLFVVEGLNEFFEDTRAIIWAGRDIEETIPDVEPPESREVFSYCPRRMILFARTLQVCHMLGEVSKFTGSIALQFDHGLKSSA